MITQEQTEIIYNVCKAYTTSYQEFKITVLSYELETVFKLDLIEKDYNNLIVSDDFEDFIVSILIRHFRFTNLLEDGLKNE